MLTFHPPADGGGASSEPSVWLVLVNWHNPSDTLECVESLRRSDFPNQRVLIVENGSRDDSLVRLRAGAADATIIATGANLGFTGGNNVGICHALDAGADYVLLLNNDTVVDPGMVRALVHVAETTPGVGIVTGKILQYGDRSRIWAAGTLLDRRFLAVRLARFGERDRDEDEPVAQVPWIVGCAMLIPRRVIEQLGMLDDRFFLTAEDLDLSLRVAHAGLKLLYAPSARLWHKESAAAGGNDAPQYVYYQTRNFLLVQARWARSMPHRMLMLLFAFAYFAKRAATFALTGRWRGVAGIAYGIRDAFLGRTGKQEYRILIRSGSTPAAPRLS